MQEQAAGLDYDMRRHVAEYRYRAKPDRQQCAAITAGLRAATGL